MYLVGVQQMFGNRPAKRVNVKQYNTLDEAQVRYWEVVQSQHTTMKKVSEWVKEVWWNDAYKQDAIRATVYYRTFVADGKRYRVMITQWGGE